MRRGCKRKQADGLGHPVDDPHLATETLGHPKHCPRPSGCQVSLQVFLSTHQSPSYSLIMP